MHRVDDAQSVVSGDQLDGGEVVDGHAVLAHQPAQTTT
jgi:hypothetical protein